LRQQDFSRHYRQFCQAFERGDQKDLQDRRRAHCRDDATKIRENACVLKEHICQKRHYTQEKLFRRLVWMTWLIPCVGLGGAVLFAFRYYCWDDLLSVSMIHSLAMKVAGQPLSVCERILGENLAVVIPCSGWLWMAVLGAGAIGVCYVLSGVLAWRAYKDLHALERAAEEGLERVANVTAAALLAETLLATQGAGPLPERVVAMLTEAAHDQRDVESLG